MSDSQDESREYGILDAFREPAICVYIFIGLAALIICHTQMIQRFNNEGSLICIFIAGAGLILRWVISPVLFLILVTYLLIDPNFQGLLTLSWGSSYRSDLFSSVLLSASVLAYLIAQYRVLSLTHQSMPIDPAPRRKGQPAPLTPRRPISLIAEGEPIAALALGLGAVAIGLAAWSLLSWYERDRRLSGHWGITRPFARSMLVLWTIGTIALLAGVFFRYVSMRRMGRLRARMMLQNMFWEETRREQERIQRWRRWARSGRPIVLEKTGASQDAALQRTNRARRNGEARMPMNGPA